MSKAPKEYTRLPGSGSRLEGRIIALSRSRCSLWMAADHLLLVDRTGYTETYKRFYYRDIQAVMIRRTSTATIRGFILGVFALLFTAWALDVKNISGEVMLWIMAGVFYFFLFADVVRGPSCVTHIKTAVQTERLPNWNHIRTARKGMRKVRPRLLQAQGEIPAEELKANLEDILRRQFQGPATEAT